MEGPNSGERSKAGREQRANTWAKAAVLMQSFAHEPVANKINYVLLVKCFLEVFSSSCRKGFAVFKFCVSTFPRLIALLPEPCLVICELRVQEQDATRKTSHT